MFGKSIFKLIKYALIVGIVIIMGTLMLSSVMDIAHMTLSGDFIPLITLVTFTIIAIRLSVTFDGSWVVIKMLLDVTAAISSAFLILVIFFGALLPLGFFAALMMSGSTAAILSIIRNPTSIQDKLSQMDSMRGMPYVGGLDRSRSLVRALDKSGMKVLILPQEAFERTLTMLKERPQLPVVLTHYQDEDVLIVKTKEDATSLRRTREVLAEYGITGVGTASPLHEIWVLSLPIQEELGPSKAPLDQFKFISHEDTVKNVLRQKPISMSIHPSNKGLRLIVRSGDVFGLEVEEIPSSLLAKVVIGRDISALEKDSTKGGEEDNAV